MNGVILNFFFVLVLFFSVCYVLAISFNLLTMISNILALGLIPFSIVLSETLAQPMQKITLLGLACFIAGVFIIKNQEFHNKKEAQKVYDRQRA